MPPLFSSSLRASSPMRSSGAAYGQYAQYSNYGQHSASALQHQHQHQQHNQQSAPNASGVQVLVRVRPPLPRELMYDSGVEVRTPHDIKVYNDAQEFSGRYHHVFGEDTPQADVYEKIRDCVPLALDGYNSTIFAYGQTGTGKTFTMMGDDPTVEGGAAPAAATAGGGGPGIIPRAVKELFREAKAKQDAEGAAVQVIVSYMEIYNDRLHDLLQPYKPQSARDPADVNQKRALLEVREDAKGNTYVPNLLCVKVKSYKSVYQLIAKGNRNRAVRHTEMNQASSRSHAILQLVIEQWPNGGADGTVIRSKLNFVDLAGSERWNTAAGGWDGGQDLYGEDRVNEMTAINGSLSALGSVVAALTERRGHVPYRDSRLTHLLQDSLGGNCRTTVLATLSPSTDAFEESCSTLRFADRARAIANNPVVNASRDMGSILALKEREIQRLRAMLSKLTGGGAGGDSEGGGGGEGAGAAAGTDASRLAEELEETRRALEMERALRTELQQRLHHGSSTSAGGLGGVDGSTGGAVVLDATTVLGALGTPATAFDAAGTPPVRPGSSLRSSAGSGGSAAGAAVGARHSSGGADFFRLSTPSTPLNSVPTHIAGAGSGPTSRAASSPSSSAVLTPTRIGGGPPTLNRSRSHLLNGHGPPGSSGGGGGGAGGPSPPRRRAEMRRLSFDEAIMSIKSQILSLTSQERARFKARQPPPQRGNWGGLPPPPAAGAPLPPQPPPLAPSASTTAVPTSLTGRTRAAVGIYGSAGGAAAAPPPRQQRRPPGLTVAPGAVVSASWGGAGGGAGSPAPTHSIEMTDSPTGSDRPSPGSVGGAAAQLRHYLQQNPFQPHTQHHYHPSQQPISPTRSAPPPPQPQPPQPAAFVRVSASSAAPGSPTSGSGSRGAAAGGAASRRRGEQSPVRSPGREEVTDYEDDFVEERNRDEELRRGQQGRAPKGSKAVVKGRGTEGDDDVDDEVEEEEEEDDDEVEEEEEAESDEVEEEEEEDMVEESVESDSDGGGRQRGRAAARKGAGGGGAARRRDSGSGSESGSGVGGSEGGLSQLDPDEYEALMREAREALAKSGKGGAAAVPEPRPAARQAPAAAAAAPPATVGGGRSALLQQAQQQQQQQTSVAASAVAGGGCGGGAAVAVSGTGWGRHSLLNRFADADAGQHGGSGGGGGGFGRSSLLAPSVPAQLSPGLATAAAPPAAAAGGGGGGGWGRRSILAAAAPLTPPPPAPPPQPAAQPPSSADAARFRHPSTGGRRALMAELMEDGDDGSGGGGGAYGSQSFRGRSPQRGSGGGKLRSRSVGGVGRPNGGSRGNVTDRAVAKLDAGSWIYILGASASSTRAKQLATALQLDPRTGLPAL